VRVDRDNFDEVLARLAPALEIPLAGGGPRVALRFAELDDFHPDQLYDRLPLFRSLRDTRQRLADPRTFADAARVGPIARQASKIAATIDDRDFTGVVAVTTPEEMTVNETLALRSALDREGLSLDEVIVNAVYPSRFDQAEGVQLERAQQRVGSRAASAALRAALSERARAAVQREQVERLKEGLGMELIELPYVFAERIAQCELDIVARVLETRLREPARAAPSLLSG
jgi:anion-transporting  ArsA/GET3 family ATPase